MDIDIIKVLDFIRDQAGKYAEAKANRVYLEEFRKSKKAMLMKEGEVKGIKTSAAQEVYAYAHEEYIQVIEGLRDAVETEEKLRWLLIGAQAKCEVFRTLSANNRSIERNL